MVFCFWEVIATCIRTVNVSKYVNYVYIYIYIFVYFNLFISRKIEKPKAKSFTKN